MKIKVGDKYRYLGADYTVVKVDRDKGIISLFECIKKWWNTYEPQVTVNRDGDPTYVNTIVPKSAFHTKYCIK
jgi:hypothetical protein